MKVLARALLLAFICSVSNISADHLHADDPVSLLEEVGVFIFSDVSANLELYTADQEALKAMIRTELIPVLDVNYAARLVLGRAGRGLPQEKVNEFADVMSNLLVERYSKGLLYFSSEVKLRVLPHRGELNEKITRVRTRVTLPKGGEAPIDYVFRKTPDGWKAFDVIVEGISYVTTYRNQIMPDVQANGIDSVINRINSGQIELAD